MSGGHGGQLDDGIIAQRGDGFQAHVAAALNSPFVVLLEEDGADEADNRVLIGEDADDLGSALDLAVEALDGIGRMDLRPVIFGEAHEGEHVGFGLVQERGELRQLGAELIGDLAPLRSGGLGVVLGEGRADEGRDDAPAALAGMGQHVA